MSDRTERSMAKLTEGLWKTVHYVAVACFSLMLATMLFQILARYVLRISVPWTDEVSRYLFIWEIFFGAAVVHRYGSRSDLGHIRITILVERLPAFYQRIMMFVSNLIVLAVMVLLSIGAYRMIGRTTGVMASTIRLSFSYIYMLQFIGVGLLALVTVKDLVDQIRLWCAGISARREPAA